MSWRGCVWVGVGVGVGVCGWVWVGVCGCVWVVGVGEWVFVGACVGGWGAVGRGDEAIHRLAALIRRLLVAEELVDRLVLALLPLLLRTGGRAPAERVRNLLRREDPAQAA